MFRTDAEGNVSGRYYEGNPALGEPATVVSADAMNSLQEEICNVIEGAGITLVKAEEDQLKAALNEIVSQGGAGNQVESNIINNLSTPGNVGGLQYSSTTYKTILVTLDAWRKTDSGEHNAIINVAMMYRPTAGTWFVKHQSQGDSMGLDFSITSAGQLQYTSDDMAGASYEGKFRISQVKKVLI